METELTPQQLAYQKKIHTSANSLSRLIDDILDFSKIEAGRLDLEIDSFGLREVLERVSSIISVRGNEKGVGFSLEIPDDIPNYLRGDALRLEQVLLNLTSNAVKFTSKGSVLAAVELVEESEQEAFLRFIVNDTGIGMSSEQIEQLFQAFQQADFSITRKYGGTGLGLAISKRLVEMMGSRIEVRSTPGKGSTFTFVTCFEKSSCDTPEAVAGIGKDVAKELLTGLRVLLVEDNETNLQVARELLEQAGLEVIAVANGLEAVSLAAQELFDGILMDLQMPVMDGLTAAREIRKGFPSTHLPIMAMTANATIADREACLAAGMNDHIAKPIKPAILYETLVRWLRPDVERNTCLDLAETVETVTPDEAGGLPYLEGIEVQAGLASLNNDRQLYLELLENFHSRYQDINKKLLTEWEHGNKSVAQRLAHTIKGLAGTVGAKKLFEISSQLELSLKIGREDAIPDLLNRFGKEVTCVMTVLDAFIRNEGAKRTEAAATEDESLTRSPSALDMTRLEKRFQELSGLIDERDSDVIKLIVQIKSLLGPSHISKKMLKLESLINRFKFDQAKETLEQVAKELGF